MADEVELFVNGKRYRGWTEVSVTRALDAIAGAFAISLTERWAGDGRTAAQREPWPILNGDECVLKIGGESVISGYVDQFRPSFSASEHTIEIQGRDRTADIVDCSVNHRPDQWANLNLLQIAQVLCKPFGVKVTAEVDVGEVFPSIKAQQGETVFSLLDRLARFRKLLLAPDGAGAVVITRAGTSRAGVALRQGVNILSASGVLDTSQRFSQYTVKGQSVQSFTQDGAAETHAEASVTDSGVARYRPLVVVAESGASSASAHDRAVWEANVRLGRSATATLTVRGWRQVPGGALWKPNQLVSVKAAWLRMDGDMLVKQVTYRRGSDGTLCELSLVSPQAFSPEPPDKDKEQRAVGRNIWREALGKDEPNS